ncbi:MAG: polysaccharide deacetylase family protein [Alphaproteobacteria bacterium]|nr:polysaccharide deacetylase family protein [Alphaproteobacteria bacterium]
MSLQGRLFREVSAALPAALTRPLGAPAAVFFHGVEHVISNPLLQENHHALDAFYAIARALKRDFEIAPLSELPDVLRSPKKHRRTVFLMSDDGYANTLSTAAGVLESFGLPWALFISTQHIDSGELNPMFIARLFSQYAPAGEYAFPGFPTPVRFGGTERTERHSFRERLRSLPAERARAVISEMRRILENSRGAELMDRYASERFLGWDEVRALAQRGVTIGAHADWHWPMHGGEDPKFLKLQTELPKRRIEAEVGTCRYFAYPFGNEKDVSGPAWRAVRDAGYDYAFTTMSGTLCTQLNPWLLPRYGLALEEPNLTSRISLLRFGNRRLSHWQRRLH